MLSMSICAGSPKFGPQGVGPLTYTISLAAHAQGILIAEYAKKQGWSKPYMLMDTNLVYNRTECGGFRWRWKQLSPDSPMAGDDSFKQDDPSIAGQFPPQGGQSQARLHRYLRRRPRRGFCGAPDLQRDLGIPIVMGPAMDGNYWLKAVPNLSNFHLLVHGSVFGDDPNPAVNDMFARFEKKYGARPATSYPIMGYSVCRPTPSR